jgi:filamentous hemagglutinin family protein
MKKTSCCIFILFFTLHLAAQDDITQAKWQPANIITDGNNSEWHKPLNLYDAITGLLFTITNDSTHIYLCFTDNDERKVIKLMKAGWSVELLSKEKNKRFDAFVVFPAVQMINAPGRDEGIANNEQPDFKNDVVLYKLNQQTVKTKGFVSANGDIPLLNSNGINVGIGSDSTQKIVFELAIPLKELLPVQDLQLKEEMTLGISVNALKKPNYHGNPDGKDLVGKGRSGGGRNRGAGAAENSAYYTDKSLLFTQIDFKQKFRLANKY